MIMSDNRKVPISGSNRRVVPNARLVGPSEPTKRLRLSVYVRRNPAEVLRAQATLDALKKTPPAKRTYPDRATVEQQFGADPTDLKAVADWAKKQNLAVISESPRTRRIQLEGTIAAISAAFDIQVNEYEHPKHGRYRSRQGVISTPPELHGIIEGVFGIDNRRVARSRRRGSGVRPASPDTFTAPPATKGAARAQEAFAKLANQWPGTFFPPQVAALYGYPPGTTGAGQNVAIFAFNGAIEAGQDPHGGYSAAALKTYFVDVLGGSMPTIKDVVVSGQGNIPGPDSPASSQRGDATGEVMLDMCVVGSCAPGANLFMYFTEFTTQGWVDALNEAITDDNAISVISISYGNPEDDPDGLWTPMGVQTVSQAFEQSIAHGITVFCASGDDGSGDGATSGAHVDFPASSPNVTGVGGTKLVASSATVIGDESVWNEVSLNEGAGGGGISTVFSKPDFQGDVTLPASASGATHLGRGVPDVAAVADPVTGVVVMHVSGKHLEPIGGTSASAPLWAALIARVNEGLKKPCGFLNTALYALGPNSGSNHAFNDITEGNNGAYEAGPGWDACSGWGSPNGQRLLDALRSG
jgi:kumamolisin